MYFNVNDKKTYNDLPLTWKNRSGCTVTGFNCLLNTNPSLVYQEGFRHLQDDLPSLSPYQKAIHLNYTITPTHAIKKYTIEDLPLEIIRKLKNAEAKTHFEELALTAIEFDGHRIPNTSENRSKIHELITYLEYKAIKAYFLYQKGNDLIYATLYQDEFRELFSLMYIQSELANKAYFQVCKKIKEAATLEELLEIDISKVTLNDINKESEKILSIHI